VIFGIARLRPGELFAEFESAETEVNRYAVERLDDKNKKLHHCTAVLDAKTRQLTGQCTERPGFPEKPTGKGPNAQGGMSNRFGGLPVFGSWKIDQTTGKLSSVFRHCSVRGGNSAIDILRKMPSLEY
jgi:hypothetical protein